MRIVLLGGALLIAVVGCAARGPSKPCSATLTPLVRVNSCAVGLWDVPIDVRVTVTSESPQVWEVPVNERTSKNSIGTLTPGWKKFGPFEVSPTTRRDITILELWVGKRRLAWAGLNCDPGEQIDVQLESLHTEGIAEVPGQFYCAGAECLVDPVVTKVGKVCQSHFDISSDAH